LRTQAWIAVVSVLLGLSTAAQAAPCDRACLKGFSDRYLAAMLAHDPSAAPLAAKVRITENGQRLDPGDGLWRTIDGLGSYKLYFDDPAAGQAGFMGVVDENGHSDILALRLKVQAGRIVQAEEVVSRPGPEGISKPELLADKPIFSEPMPSAERRPRAQMIATVRAYLDALIDAKPHPDLFTADCTRIEDGMVTANNPAGDKMGKLTCGEQLATGVSRRLSRIRDARFPLVDPERGLVHLVMVFDHTGVRRKVTVHFADGTTQDIDPRSESPFSYLCSEVFKLDGGRVRQIEAVVVPVPYGLSTGWPGGDAPRTSH
jgi:hypothetical protein